MKPDARILRAAAVLVLLLTPADEAHSEKAAGAANAAGSAAKRPASSAAAAIPVASVGRRTVDNIDIQRAAVVLASDPLRKKNPPAWKRMLLDRCVDRELLAMEAQRLGLDKDPEIRRKLADREYLTLLRETYARILLPGLIPTHEQLSEIRAGKLYRGVELHYILVRDNEQGVNRALAQRVYASAKAGARFDSLAKIYSGHPPSQAAGGRFGWLLAKDLDPASYDDVRKAQVGDVLGIYSNPYGHQIYKIGAFQELSEDSLYNLVYFERKRGIANDYERSLLTGYRFAIDSTLVNAVMFATGTESPDSILASLRPDGTRERAGVKPALGILARCDGDSVTFPDIVRATPPILNSAGRMRIGNTSAYYALCARAVLHKLTVRDATDRGLTKDPAIARELRLGRDQILTEAMVHKNLPPAPDDAALRGVIEAHPERFRRPRSTVARVAIFANPESAAQALHDWTPGGMADSLLAARQLRLQPRATLRTLHSGFYATLTLPEDGSDSLSHAMAGLAPGSFAPVTRTLRGWAVAQALSKLEPGPLPFEESAPLARREWRENAENSWVKLALATLRTKTPPKEIAGRLDAVKLALSPSSSGGSAR